VGTTIIERSVANISMTHVHDLLPARFCRIVLLRGWRGCSWEA